MPATNLSWHDAKAYVAWLSNKTAKPYRLLTHTEWEYAARAKARTAYWWGDTITPGLANYDPIYREPSSLSQEQLTHLINNPRQRSVVPVDRYAPNLWGLCSGSRQRLGMVRRLANPGGRYLGQGLSRVQHRSCDDGGAGARGRLLCWPGTLQGCRVHDASSRAA